eukprot:COSAG03_NODE_17500_length_374_cov_0.785455_2_plen_91_part_01
MEQVNLYSPNNAVGMSDAQVRDLWKTRVRAFPDFLCSWAPYSCLSPQRNSICLKSKWDRWYAVPASTMGEALYTTRSRELNRDDTRQRAPG